MIKRVLKNMMLLISLFLLNCENKRRLNTDLEKSSHTFRSFETEHLDLDYYRPKPSTDNLPLVIYVHGGGFSNGEKDSPSILKLAHKLTEMGYATISLSYRLTRANLDFNCNTSAEEKIKTFDAASEDVAYAINYILDNNSIFKINKKDIVIIGSSAGAEAVLNLVYTYNQNIIPQQFKFAGIISKAGALTSLEDITSNTAVPMLLFHGSEDNIVPYGIGSHHNCNINEDGYLKLYGSRAISNRLKQLNKPYHLVTLKEGNHGMYGLSQSDFFNEIFIFLSSLNTKNENEQIENFY